MRTFLGVFGNLSETVIWQFGSEPETQGIPLPENVLLYSWVPLQKLFGKTLLLYTFTPSVQGGPKVPEK